MRNSGKSRVRRCFDQRGGTGFLRIKFHRSGFVVVVDFCFRHPRHFFQRFLDRDRAEGTRHLLYIEDNGLRTAGKCSDRQGKQNGY
jgi:hypothetical protein